MKCQGVYLLTPMTSMVPMKLLKPVESSLLDVDNDGSGRVQVVEGLDNLRRLLRREPDGVLGLVEVAANGYVGYRDPPTGKKRRTF